MTDTTTAGAADAGRTISIEQHSEIGRYFWVGYYSMLLGFVTFTLYRFWARTQVRREIWKDTVIDGEPLDYVGKGSELFIGFLITTFLIVLPLSGALIAAQMLGQPAVVAGIFAVVYLAAPVAIGAALYLSRRYLLSRTLWRGVRFAQGGSALGYGFATLGYTILSAITLGWFAPAARLRLARQMWSEAKFGDQSFTFDNSPENRTEPVYQSFALAWFGGLIGYGVLLGGVAALGMFDPDNSGDPDFFISILPAYLGLLFGFLVVVVLLSVWHEVVMIRQITKSISLPGVALRSRLNTWSFLGVAVTNLLLIAFTLGIGLFAAQMRVWRQIARNIEVEGAIDYAAIEQAASRGPAHGEGLADAFDLSGGV